MSDWVSVDADLPNDGDVVLANVFTETGNYEVLTMFGYAEDGNLNEPPDVFECVVWEWFYDTRPHPKFATWKQQEDGRFISSDPDAGEITHWIHAPKPPKEMVEKAAAQDRETELLMEVERLGKRLRAIEISMGIADED